jgi:hypothetical protein
MRKLKTTVKFFVMMHNRKGYLISYYHILSYPFSKYDGVVGLKVLLEDGRADGGKGEQAHGLSYRQIPPDLLQDPRRSGGFGAQLQPQARGAAGIVPRLDHPLSALRGLPDQGFSLRQRGCVGAFHVSIPAITAIITFSHE